MSNFEVGQDVQIGTKDDLPNGWDTPQPARCICVDAKALHDIRVVVLAQTAPGNPLEVLRQFNTDGLCLSAINAEGNPNMNQYLNSNLYPADE